MRLLTLGLAFILALSACSQKNANEQAVQSVASVFQGSDISRDNIGGNFTLTADNHKPFDMASLHGKVVILTFGFTHCPDVCPTELAGYADVMKQLGEQSKNVAVVFVSVDPERDTPELVGKYARLFDERFIGLSAANGQDVAAVQKLYRVTARKIKGKTADDYTVEHTAGTYLLDKNGRAVVFEPFGKTATEIADDVKTLLK
ncbi:MAG: SCO family protein [Neisseria sp.]|uniref:SCO family protein n=1 Tax=Neisseria sp. TaxID=192066 RepID=UPI0026DD4D66|nr:SCO family protein [Neisseria sp.]MDO4642027.1 SCO family protein [Neisseria sp.]